MIDNTPRWIKIGDAMSQLLNVALLPRHKETTANESISGRAHRCGWRAERWIDAIFRPWEKDHCRNSHEADVARSMKLLGLEAKREIFVRAKEGMFQSSLDANKDE